MSSHSRARSFSLSLLDDDPFAASPVIVVAVERPRSSSGSSTGTVHTRSAFSARPSLPSLHALAQLNVSIPSRKIRKGTPGARLPHEPWDMDLSTEFHLLTRINPSVARPPPGTRLASETDCSRSSSGDDADADSLHSVSALSRSSSASLQQPRHMVTSPNFEHDAEEEEEDDPLSYHSDFDYYTQSFSDPSDSEHHDPKPPPSVGVTPYSSLYDPALELEPASSPDTMRRVSIHPQTDTPLDSNEWRGQPHVPESRRTTTRGREASRRNGDCPPIVRAGHDNGNGDSAPRPKHRSSASTTSDYTSSSSSSSDDDDADGITVYYSLDGMSNGRRSRSHSRTRSRHSKCAAGSDDDVPLAQRVPTALSAQKSIRKQLHDERQQRRLERARSSRRAADPPLPSKPVASLSTPATPSRFRKRSVSAAPAPVSNPRIPTTEPFPAEDLTRKLVNLQSPSRTPASLTLDSSMPTIASPRVPGYSGAVSRSSSRGKYADYSTYLQHKNPRVPEPSSQERSLRSMRSFHRPDGRYSETPRSPVDPTSAPRLGRSATAVNSSRTPRTGRDVPAAGHEQHPKSTRVSEEGRRPSASIPRPSVDRENEVAQRVVQRPPIPPLPISDSTPPQLVSRVPVVQQRIFVGDMQRFNMVEITPATNAGDVLDTVARQGMLDRSGSWMVFEMAQDYGMERPIREYELLSDVSASWNKDKLLNAFVIKQTPLAPLLSRAALPTSSPMNRGWVEWESKRGKWSKRWMELREHGLWLSKRDTGKDEVFLCSLSNFDAYSVTRRYKAPKPFTFAIKSTDHLSMFENAADYLHIFSCNPSDGEKWMQAILVARSYVLYQERNVLFAKTGEALSQAKPLARARTRKQSVSRPAQPLINVPPPFSQAPTANIAFEPGSLLAKRKEITQP